MKELQNSSGEHNFSDLFIQFISDYSTREINQYLEDSSTSVKIKKIFKNFIRLKFDDNSLLDVQRNSLSSSVTITDALKEIDDDDWTFVEILIINFNRETMVKVVNLVEIFEVHVAEKSLAMSMHDPQYILPQLLNALKKYQIHEIADILRLLDYLAMETMLQMVCKYVANLIRDKEPEEIRRILDIEDDLNDEEKAAIQKEIKLISKSLKK